jgi:hypothetical protein
MARLPMRLEVRLAKARLLGRPTPVRHLRSEEILHAELKQPVAHEAVRELIRKRNSIVWLGGSEPLAHPGIGHLARLLVGSGHFLFLETDAQALRQRIHEFQPADRFYFVVRFHGNEAEHDRRMGQAGAYQRALEGVRAAGLSGFWLLAKLELAKDSRELRGLSAALGPLGFDGMMVLAPDGASGVSPASNSWSRFLRQVEASRVGLERLAPGGASEPDRAQEESCEEVAEVR